MTLRSPTYCSKIYKSLYIEKNNDGNVAISPCCVSKTNPVEKIDFYKDPILLENRIKVQAGEKLEKCNYCWNLEDKGLGSYRDKTNEIDWKNDSYEVKLVKIDYNVPPICNAKCIVCSAFFSSAWAEEDRKFKRQTTVRSINNILKSNYDLGLDLTSLVDIYFNGGEPFLTNDIVIMLKEIKSQQGSLSKLTVDINSNGSIFPNEEQLSLLKECKRINFRFSIDAIEEQFEYIRYPLKWDQVSSNIENICKELPQALIFIVPNAGVHNILEMNKVKAWSESLGTRVSNKVICRVSPTLGNLSLDQTSKELKLLLKEALVDPDPIVLALLNNAQDRPDVPRKDNINIWSDNLWRIDNRRNLNWKETFKKLNELNELVKQSINKQEN